MATPTQPAARTSSETDNAFFGHPRGLSTLFFTEMWERFSYYGMRAILILFMTAPLATGGLGFDAATAGPIYALYTALVYLVALPGGWFADRIIGQQRAVLYGGIIIMCGHISLAMEGIHLLPAGPLPGHHRHRPAQAQHQHHRGPALRRRGPPARRRVLDLLHGHQPRRRASRRWSAATWRRARVSARCSKAGA